jgi:LytR cell envelope-related transcriptional attenuator
MDEQRWRTATIAISAFAGIEFVAIAVLAVALVGNPLASHLEARAAAAAAPRVRTSSPRPRASAAQLPRSETSVIVLNGGAQAGAAAVEARRVRGRGYIVGNVGNAARMDYTRTLVMYRPGYGPEGARLAHDLHIRIVSPLDGIRVSQLAGSHLVVILGA